MSTVVRSTHNIQDHRIATLAARTLSPILAPVLIPNRCEGVLVDVPVVRIVQACNSDRSTQRSRLSNVTPTNSLTSNSVDPHPLCADAVPIGWQTVGIQKSFVRVT